MTGRASLDALFPGTEPVLLDGAMGTALHAAGWAPTRPTALACLEAPRLVEATHAAHVAAGARVVGTNTFGLLALPASCRFEALDAAVALARGSGAPRVAATLAGAGLARAGLAGREVLEVLAGSDVDLLVIETVVDPEDARACLEALARLERAPPVVACASSTDGTPADRARVEEVLEIIARDEGAVPGLNCGRGPDDLLELAGDPSRVPWLSPSTGVTPPLAGAAQMNAFARAAMMRGVRFIGGCCGTTPELLAGMADALAEATS